MKLRSENIEQVLKLQTTDKDKQIASKIIEIKKLKMRIASLVHENNVDHLERQQLQRVCVCPAIGSPSLSLVASRPGLCPIIGFADNN